MLALQQVAESSEEENRLLLLQLRKACPVWLEVPKVHAYCGRGPKLTLCHHFWPVVRYTAADPPMPESCGCNFLCRGELDGCYRLNGHSRTKHDLPDAALSHLLNAVGPYLQQQQATGTFIGDTNADVSMVARPPTPTSPPHSMKDTAYYHFLQDYCHPNDPLYQAACSASGDDASRYHVPEMITSHSDSLGCWQSAGAYKAGPLVRCGFVGTTSHLHSSTSVGELAGE